jgi:hypothetical protein
MAEVGLLPFARIALQVSKAVLPRYRTRFSKRLFNQPQLLAILCLMRYEDWTFREAEVRLGEHRELRQALGLARVPDFTTLYRFLQRLDDVTIDQAVGETVRRLRGTRKKGQRRARVAVDATGLAQGAVSTFFVRRMPRSARGDAAGVSATDLPASRPGRNSVLFGQAQTLGPRAGPFADHAKASGAAARLEFQSVSPEASLPFLKDVNRAE